LGNICRGRERTEAQKTDHKYFRRNSPSLVARWKVDLFQIQPSWREGSLSLSRLRRKCRFTIQRCRRGQPAGVLRWEDSIFCKPRRKFDAEENGPVGAARYGIRSGWIASRERLKPLGALSRRYLFCSCRSTQSPPLL